MYQVGGGPTGLTMALSLIKYGVKVRIIEEATSPHEAIRGTAILSRTLDLLAILGVKDDLDELALPPLQMAIYDPTGLDILMEFDWSTPAEDKPDERNLTAVILPRYPASISQAALEDILRRRSSYVGMPRWPKKLVGITQDADKVTAWVDLAYRPSETIECAFSSYSRRFLDIPFIGETKETDRMFTANVRVPGFSREVMYWHRWGDFAKAAISLKPINPTPLFQLQALGPTTLKEVPNIVFEDASCISERKTNIRMVEKLSSGRVFLTGDAAHCHSPASGQGTSTVMQDALNLAWQLSLVVKGVADISLLSTYDSERLPVVAEMLNLSSMLHARAFTHIPEAAFEAAPVTSEVAMHHSAKTLQLGVNYRWRLIVRDARDTGEQSMAKNPYGIRGSKVRAGDRAPFFGGIKINGEEIDLFHLLGESAGAHPALGFPGYRRCLVEEVEVLKNYSQIGLATAVLVGDGDSQDVPGARSEADAERTMRTSYEIDRVA
ncbi:hypothetical protein B0H10DRAFT_2164095 [Mycena sp. CBHHK59/15]|nr:hypothetical protein B0H10DRAFT_2164095 [Mycena sp. CBHHK59/15]